MFRSVPAQTPIAVPRLPNRVNSFNCPGFGRRGLNSFRAPAVAGYIGLDFRALSLRPASTLASNWRTSSWVGACRKLTGRLARSESTELAWASIRTRYANGKGCIKFFGAGVSCFEVDWRVGSHIRSL